MTADRIKLLLQFVGVAGLTVVTVSQISSSIIDEPISDSSRTEQIIDSRLNGQQLQVQPATGSPRPLDAPLQSSRDQSGQEATGDLQQPQNDLQQQGQSQGLQPNAGVDQLPENYDF